MKTRDNIDEQIRSSDTADPKHGARRIVGMVGAVLVVVLVVGVSAVVFAQLSQQHKNQAALPPTGSWVQVLSGYTLTSIAAAGTTPSLLYACATHAQLYTPLPGLPPNRIGTGNDSYTVLRSTDFGTHWQDVGGQANLGSGCQLAINPADSNELYAVGSVQNNGQAASVLRHSTDGGQTWATISPTLNVQPAVVWNVQQLSMVGNRLFGVQWLPRRLSPATFQGTLPKYYAPLTRLVTSVDGGHTWTVLDNQFAAARQNVRSYAVDPSNVSTIYEVVGSPWFPLPLATEPNDTLPLAGSTEDLYKTSDNGASWHLVLKGLPFGAHVDVQLVQGNSQMIYAGGSVTPVPYVAAAPGEGSQNVTGSFQLHLSRDGGASWHDVPAPPQSPSVQSWFAAADGQVYISSGGWFAGPGGQPTAVSGTVVPSTPRIMPSSVPQGSLPVTTGDLSIPLNPVETHPPNVTPGPLASMQRYNPATNAWSTVTAPPSFGTLLALTPGGDVNGGMLWFMGTNKAQQPALYRYIA